MIDLCRMIIIIIIIMMMMMLSGAVNFNSGVCLVR